MHRKVQEGHNDVCVPIFLNAGVLFAVLLGFMVIAVWESYDAAKTTAATEATALVPLYRAAETFRPRLGQIRALVRKYIHQVIEDEWPIQAESGRASSKARKQIGDLFGPSAMGPSPRRVAIDLKNSSAASYAGQARAGHFEINHPTAVR